MQKVKVGFQKDAIPQKMQKTAVVVGQITGNPAFPKAQPMLADVTASVSALDEASQAAQSSQAATKQLFEVQNQKLATSMRSWPRCVTMSTPKQTATKRRC